MSDSDRRRDVCSGRLTASWVCPTPRFRSLARPWPSIGPPLAKLCLKSSTSYMAIERYPHSDAPVL